MATRRGAAIEVDGTAALRRDLRRLAGPDLDDALREANKKVGAVVADEAARLVPRRSGRLARSIEAVASEKFPIVRAGTKGSVPYAGPIHFGWPTRGLHRVQAALQAARVAILEGRGSGAFGLRAIGKVERRGRSVAKGRRRAIRGGPIKANPFLYDAADRRRREVLERYERAMDDLAKAFNRGT